MSRKNAVASLNEAMQVINQADAEGRSMSAEERSYAKGLLDRAEAANGAGVPDLGMSSAEVGRRLGGGSVAGEGSHNLFAQYAATPGARFVASEQVKSILDPMKRPQAFDTGPVDVGPLMQTKAGTLFESGQGAGLIPVPQVVPGVVQTLFQPLGVADLFQQGVATSSAVRVVVEGTATNAAAGVAEGGTKPSSDLALSTTDEPVKKIATVLTCSDELLDDVGALQNYVNNRLSLFCRMEEDRQLLRGAGGNEVVGLFSRSINAYTKLGADDNATSLARVIANTAGSSFISPDTVIMHPTNWLSTRLLRDGAGGTVGQFYGGGPFSYGPYGGAATGPTPGLFGQTLWGVRVFLTTVVGPGTALVGSFTQGAQLWSRGGVNLAVSNSHQDYFQKDLVMIRAESRRALACYRPNSFTAVSGLS